MTYWTEKSGRSSAAVILGLVTAMLPIASSLHGDWGSQHQKRLHVGSAESTGVVLPVGESEGVFLPALRSSAGVRVQLLAAGTRVANTGGAVIRTVRELPQRPWEHGDVWYVLDLRDAPSVAEELALARARPDIAGALIPRASADSWDHSGAGSLPFPLWIPIAPAAASDIPSWYATVHGRAAMNADLPVGNPSGSATAPLTFCVPTTEWACLLNRRFEVDAWWSTSSSTGNAKVAHLNGNRAETNQSVLFWFFGPDNIELTVKMVDACSFNGSFWIFAAAMTNQFFVLSVTDVITHNNRSVLNPLNNYPPSIGLTDAVNGLPCP